MQLGDDGVFEKGTISLHLDSGNITVNASEDVLLVAGKKVILESIRMRTTIQVALQTNLDQYVLISDNLVGIKRGKFDFQKVEIPLN